VERLLQYVVKGMLMELKKYQVQGDKPYPHMGTLVKARLRKRGITNAVLARKLDITPIGVTRYFGRASLQAGILWKISLIADYNLFAELGMLLPVPFQYTVHEQSIKALEAQCIEKDNRIADLEKE
jgi:hypothetical protein